MDSLLLKAVLAEVREELADRPITRVQLVAKYGVLLDFGGAARPLWISAHPELSRLGLIDEPVTEPRPAPDSLAAPLLRARLARVDQEVHGRVAVLHFENTEGRHKTPRIVAELIPRFANVILVSSDERALWTRREFTGASRRTVAAGRPYELPSSESGTPFAELDAAKLAARLAEGTGPLHRRIPRGWGGGQKGFARALDESVDTEEEFTQRLVALAASSDLPLPRLARRDEDGATVLFPADPGALRGWTLAPAASANETVDAYYQPREQDEETGTLLAELRRVLVKRRSRAAKALRRIEQRLDDAAHEAEIRVQAELLAANVGTLRRGMRSVRLPAFDGSGEIEITLDPKKDGQANVDALFKRARRLARGLEELETEQAVQQAEVEVADTAIEELEPEPTPDRLRELVREQAPELLSAPGKGSRGGQRTPRPRPPAGTEDSASAATRPTTLPDGFTPRVYVLPGGWEVWVGRSARQNDELTHRRASQKDLWFHARGCQGSHTVLRMSSGKGEPPREIVEAAASIAAFHSKARKSNLVPVAYTEKRYVRRPRGAPAGTAAMMREKVLMVEPKEPDEAAS